MDIGVFLLLRYVNSTAVNRGVLKCHRILDWMSSANVRSQSEFSVSLVLLDFQQSRAL